MRNDPNCRHDFDDDLSDIFGGASDAPWNTDDNAEFAKSVLAPSKTTSTVTYEEPCRDCRGTGKFRSYSGRIVGDCFKCKGAGVRRYKQTSEQREKARAAAAAKREAKAAEAVESAAVWFAANPDEAKWLRDAAARGFEFAVSLQEALLKYGHLTEKQEAAVRKATAKSLERQAQWAAERAEREANKAEVSIDRIAQAFASAKAAQLKWPKLYLDTFTFSLAGENSANAGAIYVKEGETYLGKIIGGRLTRSRDCSAEIEARIVAVCADPHAAAVAYGKETGRCSCCGRELTNALSIELGIGPVCRDKWGWA